MKLPLARLGLRFPLVAVIAYGLYLNLYGAFNAFQPWLLLFYTTQSNALVLLLFLVICVYDLKQLAPHYRETRLPQWLQGSKTALTWAISITGIVWHLMLAPYIENYSGLEILTPELLLSFSLLHTWSPLLAFIDWIMFDPKGTLKRLTPLRWLLIPIAYFAFICVWVAFVGPVNPDLGLTYPYPFIDFATYGALAIWRNVAFIAAGMLLLAYLFYAADKLLAKTTLHISSK